MGKQKLSPLAAKRKAVRDKEYAMSTDRKNKKAENQRKRRAAKKIEDERLAKQLFDDVSVICNSKSIDVFRLPLLNKF